MLKWTAALGAAILLCAQTSRIAEDDAERAFLDVTVNAVERGQVVAILSGDGDVSLSGADLQRLGVPSLPLRGSIGNNDVSLRALAPTVTFTVDPVALRLRIVIDPKALPRQAIAIGAGSLPSDVVADHPKSSFVNYDVSVSTLTKPTSFIEAGYSHGNTLLYSSAMVDPGGISSRGMTYATFDDPRHQTRTQIGDADVAGSMLLDDLPMFGVSKRRYFELDPFSYRFPAPSLGGTIATPGTANVYVNGDLIRSVQLQPGSFNLSQIPVTAGNNAVAVVVRGDDGRTQTFGQSYFAVNSLLVKGMTDYDYSVGLVRRSGSAAAYGMPALAATYRLGASAGATFGGTLEATGMAQVARLESDLRLPEGAIQLGAAASSMRGGHGAAFDALLALGGDPTSLSASVLYRGPTFAQIGASEPPGFQPPGFSTNVTLNHSFRSDAASTLRTIRTATARRAKRRTAPPFPFR